MVDLHTHILYDVDDGPQSIDDSISMLKVAKHIGIDHVVLTPHISKFRHGKCSKEEMISKYELLKSKVAAANMDLNLYLGAEIDEDDTLVKTIECGNTINKSSYVLIDFSMRQADVSEVLYELRHYGYKVIVAHPERLYYLSLEDLCLIKNEGALFQVSSKHIIGLGNKKACKMAKVLLKENLIDIISSDAHDIKTILSMKKAFIYIKKKKGLLYANKLFVDNPFDVLNIKYN